MPATSFDDALNTLVIVDKISAKMILMRYND